MPRQNSELIALFTVSNFPKALWGEKNKAQCWTRTAAATAAATGGQNGPRLSGSSSGYRCTPLWLRASGAGDLSPRWASPRVLSWHVLKKRRCLCAMRAVQMSINHRVNHPLAVAWLARYSRPPICPFRRLGHNHKWRTSRWHRFYSARGMSTSLLGSSPVQTLPCTCIHLTDGLSCHPHHTRYAASSPRSCPRRRAARRGTRPCQ